MTPRRSNDITDNGDSFLNFTDFEFEMVHTFQGHGATGAWGGELVKEIEAATGKAIDLATFFRALKRLGPDGFGLIEETGKVEVIKTGATRKWRRLTAKGQKTYAANVNFRMELERAGARTGALGLRPGRIGG